MLRVPVLLTATAAVASAQLGPGQHKRTMEFDGAEREFYIHVPSVGNHRPMPIVFGLHGMGTNYAHVFPAGIDMDEVAEEEGFITVWPQGSRSNTPALTGRTWNAGNCCNSGDDDVTFLREVLGLVREEVDVDNSRIYWFGFSAGGSMSHRIACEMDDIAAAVVGVSGTVVVREDCNPSRPVPVQHWHGKLDAIFSYGGLVYTGAQETFDIWSEVDSCEGEPIVEDLERNVWEQRHENCTDATQVSLITLDRGGHSWPRADQPERRMWEFMSKFTIPASDEE